MIQRILFFYAVFFTISLPCAGQNHNINKPFPEQIDLPLIRNYIERNMDMQQEDSRHEYIYILNYLERCVSVYTENIYISLVGEPRVRRYSAMIDGRLDFIDDEDFVFVWSEKSKEWTNIARDNSVSEVFVLICVYITYNQLIDHWFLMTEDILANKYDIKKEIEGVLNTIKEYDSGGITVSGIPLDVLLNKGENAP
jgi:hypothetical protein